jgi:transcriptional regulator with XRE-family HTH domain
MAIEDKARARRIAELRTRKRLTQEQMAQRLDVAYRTYQTWESQKVPVMPDWPNLEKLARFHGVKPEDIIGETPDVGALLGNGTSQSQLDRIEADVAAIRVELGALVTQLEDLQRSLARKTNTGASSSRSRKAK